MIVLQERGDGEWRMRICQKKEALFYADKSVIWDEKTTT